MKHYYTFFTAFFSSIALLEFVELQHFVFVVPFIFVPTLIIKPKLFPWITAPVIIAISTILIHTPSLNSPNHIHHYNNTQQTFTATIIDVDERSTYTFITLTDIQINNQPIEGNILVKNKRHPVFQYNDHLQITAKLQTPEPTDTFNYPKFLALRNIYSRTNYPKIKKITTTNTYSPTKLITDLRSNIELKFRRLLSEPHASFIAGLLIGSRRGLPEDLLKDFQTTGLTHIIAISGYNITLLILFINKSLYFLNRKAQILAASLLIISFTILVGASAAVVRAALMGIISLFAILCRRKNQLTLALLWSGFFMVLINPLTLIYDIGFQLSFLAVLSLIYILPKIENLFHFIPNKGFIASIKEGILTTIAAQVLVLPIILTNFQNLSIISPIANVLVAPFLPIAMLSGFILLIISIIFPPLTIIFKTLTWISLEIVVQITKFCAAIPFAGIEITWFNYFHAAIYFLLIFFWLKPRNSKSSASQSYYPA